jgi:hypothetical protein
MKTQIFLIVTFLSLLLVISSCNKDDDSIPTPIQTPDIYGSWTVLQTDEQGVQFNVELSFNTDNTFDWILLDSVEGHNNGHAVFNLTANVMVINNDVDCNSEGEYILVKEVDKLAIIALSDGCEPRKRALEYLWKKK